MSRKCETVKKTLLLSVQNELGFPAELTRSKSDRNLIQYDTCEINDDSCARTKASSSNSLFVFSVEDKEKQSLKYLKALAKDIKNPIKRTEVRFKTTQNNDTVNKIIFQRRESTLKTVKDMPSSNLFLKLIPCLTEEDFEIELIECDDDT
jgi:hypothetical protein